VLHDLRRVEFIERRKRRPVRIDAAVRELEIDQDLLELLDRSDDLLPGQAVDGEQRVGTALVTGTWLSRS